MRDFFYYEIFVLTPGISVKPVNIFIWIGFYYAARITRVALSRYVRKKNMDQQQIVLAGRKTTLISLARQLVTILFVILALQSLSFTNNGNGLRELLDIKLLEMGRFKLTMFNIFLVIILLVAARLFNTITRLFIQRTLSGKQWIDRGREYTIVLMAQYFIYTVFAVMALRSFGVDLTLLVASSAALFVGLGLGIQKIFADLISGLIILFDGSIKVGDIVEIAEGHARVIEINIRTSRVRTTGGNVVIIPNSKLTTEKVSHWSFNNKPVRYWVSVEVAGRHEVEMVKQLLHGCAFRHKHVDKQRNIVVLMDGFTPDTNQFRLCFWTEKIWEIETIKSDLLFAIQAVFAEKGLVGTVTPEKKEENPKNETATN